MRVPIDEWTESRGGIDGGSAQKTGDETELVSIPSKKVRRGSVRRRWFDDINDLLRVGGNFEKRVCIGPVSEEGLSRPMLPNTNFNRFTLNRSECAPMI